MNWHQIAGLIAGVFSIVGYIVYGYVLLSKRKNINPNLSSWMLWTSSYVLICVSYYFSGARTTIWVPLVYAVANIVILLLIFKHGYYKLGTFEKILIAVTILSVPAWAIFNTPFATLVINMGIDGAAIIPTALKVYRRPLSENKTAWGFFTLADVTNIFAIQKWSLRIALYPVVAAICCLTTFLFLYGKSDHR
jgi:hypothetical protein